jgi:hypothetical protein
LHNRARAFLLAPGAATAADKGAYSKSTVVHGKPAWAVLICFFATVSARGFCQISFL